MLNYILLIMFLIVAGFIGYYTFILFKNARASNLYSKVAFAGFLGIISILLNFTMLLIKTLNIETIEIDFYLFTMLVQTLFSYNLFSIWKIRHNQHQKQNYQLPIGILTLINIVILILNKYKLVIFIDDAILIYLPIIINIVLMLIPNILFLQYKKQSVNSEFSMYPMIIFILILTNVGLIFYNYNQMNYTVYFAMFLLQSLAHLFMLKVSVDDYRKSFYY